jgi:hypothetical protein
MACCLLAALAGCGGKNYQPPPAADPALARSSLERGLDAWRLRITPEELLKAEPAITFADSDWRSGHRLVEFQLQPGEQALGTSIYWPVKLRVAYANGYEQWLDVTYIISTNPIIHISRQD